MLTPDMANRGLPRSLDTLFGLIERERAGCRERAGPLVQQPIVVSLLSAAWRRIRHPLALSSSIADTPLIAGPALALR